MKYIAKHDIGNFKEGDEVPEEQALIWKSMYNVSPVDEVNESVEEKNVETDIVEQEEEKKPSRSKKAKK